LAEIKLHNYCIDINNNVPLQHFLKKISIEIEWVVYDNTREDYDFLTGGTLVSHRRATMQQL
jgi:hypothetical protein